MNKKDCNLIINKLRGEGDTFLGTPYIVNNLL